jgi:predicted ferric reductase
MDRIYRSHKWAGILAVVFAAMHWLIELSGDILKSTIGREGRVPKEEFSGLLEVLRHLAKDMGEWAIYAVLLMLLVSLWKRFPYHTWRVIHRAMPIIYLVLAFHAAFLAPVAYWVQPAGALLALFLIAGIYGAIRSLSASIGRSNLSAGKIVGIDTSSPGITTVRCEMLNGWPGHKAGQFAFVTFSDKEGAHPFTIANADHGDRIITFHHICPDDFTAKSFGYLRGHPKSAIQHRKPAYPVVFFQTY